MNAYFEVNAELLNQFLASKGFTQTIIGNEIVYIRRHHLNSKLVVRVYTSLPSNGVRARECGADAIRVVAILEGKDKTYGIGKFPRLYRQAPVEMSAPDKHKYLFDRLLERMRSAYARCNEWLREQKSKR